MYHQNTQRYVKGLNSPVRSNYTLYRKITSKTGHRGEIRCQPRQLIFQITKPQKTVAICCCALFLLRPTRPLVIVASAK